MAVLQIAQFALEIFICPYHISFVVAMYAVATSQGPLQIWTLFFGISTQGEDLERTPGPFEWIFGP